MPLPVKMTTMREGCLEQITADTTEKEMMPSDGQPAPAVSPAGSAGRRTIITILTGLFIALFLMGLGALYVTFFMPYGQLPAPEPSIVDTIPPEEQLFFDAAKTQQPQSELLALQEAGEQQLLADVAAEMILSGKTLPFEITFEPARTCYAASAVSLYEGPDEEDYGALGSLKWADPVTVLGRVTSYRRVVLEEILRPGQNAEEAGDAAAPQENAQEIEYQVLDVEEPVEIDWYLVSLPGTDNQPAFVPAEALTDTDPYAAARTNDDLPVDICSCRIASDNVQVIARVTGDLPELKTESLNYALFKGADPMGRAPAGAGSDYSLVNSEDGLFHLIAQGTYVSGSNGTEVATAPIGAGASFTFPLNKNSASSNLMKRFIVCVMRGGELVPVSSAHYITNPEACATLAASRQDHGKKGILPASGLVYSSDLLSLGVQQVSYNLNLGELCAGGGIGYTYNGRSYSFNSSMISGYDRLIQRFNSMGLQVTMILLNNKYGDQTLIHPSARGGSAHYYMLNCDEEAGAEKLAAVMSFLANRYAGIGHGQIDNWIIGNEINAYSDWNYMSAGDVKSYTDEYAEGFRICYNAIRSENANARVYTCIDQQWSSSISSRYFPGKSFLNAFQNSMVNGGNIAWHLAAHPYNYPLTDPSVWVEHGQVTHSSDSPYLSMRNIEVLTDYLCQSHYLTPQQEVRSVLLSEVGYTSSRGEGLQAASVVYAYLQTAGNQHVDGLILSREQDHGTELAQGLALGLLGPGGGKKLAYTYYQGIDGAGAQAIIDQASAVIGVPDLRTLLTPR